MSPSEKAKITRKLHEERRRQKEQEAKQIRDKMVSGLLFVLDSNRVSAEQKLEAIKILHEITKGER